MMIENKEVSKTIDEILKEAVKQVKIQTGFKIRIGWWFEKQSSKAV